MITQALSHSGHSSAPDPAGGNGMSKRVLRLRERETEECERSWGSPGLGVTGTQVFCPVPVDEPWDSVLCPGGD